MLRWFLSLLLALTLVGCPMSGHVPELLGSVPMVAGDTDLTGRVVWDARQVQATMSDVASASTVSLINTVTGETAATTVTDGQGKFKLSFPTSFQPNPAVSYYLEAVKGLGSNQPGKNAARVRTIARYVGGWTTLTNAAPDGSIVVGSTTTAVAIAGALRGVTDYTTYMGSVDPATSVYTAPGGSLLTGGDATSAKAIVLQVLAADADPVAGVALVGGIWTRVNSGQPLSLTQLSPNSAVVGATIQATGSLFSQLAENVVSFNGTASAAVASSDGTTLSVVVPSGATSGQTTVKVGNVTALGPLFTVLPRIDSLTPRAGVAADAAGRTGSLVTVYGQGFGSNGTITLNGTAMTVVSWSNASIVAALPFGATTGVVAVTTGGNAANGPTLTVVANAAPNADFEAYAAGNNPTTAASDGGNATVAVASSTGARSGSKVLRWTSATGAHRRMLPGIKPTKTVVVAGFWVRLNSTTNNWSNGKGLISGRSVVQSNAMVWGTPWLSTYPAGSPYPYTVVPGTQPMMAYPIAEGWQYIQATASAIVGSNYDYGVVVQCDPWIDNGYLFDVDDLILFDCDP